MTVLDKSSQEVVAHCPGAGSLRIKLVALFPVHLAMVIVKEELQLAQNAFAERVCDWVINISHYNDRGEEGGTP